MIYISISSGCQTFCFEAQYDGIYKNMSDSQIQQSESEGIYLERIGQTSQKEIKLKLGLAELIFQALILVLLV